MQHTLLPAPERAMIRREYHVRFWIVALFSISVAGTIGVAALFPAYIRGSLEERFQLESIANIQKNMNASGIVNVEQELATDKILLAALAEGSDAPLLSADIEDLLAERGTVKITSISIQRPTTGGLEIVLMGIGPTRESLNSFKSRLERIYPPGTVVDLPLSQLTKSTNVPFSMRVTVKPKS